MSCRNHSRPGSPSLRGPSSNRKYWFGSRRACCWTMSNCRPMVLGSARRRKPDRYLVGYSVKEKNVLFNDALNTFYLRLYGFRHMVKDHSDSEKGTRCRHIGYSYRLTARVLFYAPSHRQDNTYHGLCYTGTL